MNESETDQIVFPKYFLSETIGTTKNGGRGTHFAKFLIFPFQWGLTHSAVSQVSSFRSQKLSKNLKTFQKMWCLRQI